MAFLGSFSWIALGMLALMLGGWSLINDAAETGENTRQREAAIVNAAAMRKEEQQEQERERRQDQLGMQTREGQGRG